ncbi:MAG TPA: NAD-glutamate dehydrogenase [Pseudomonadales bacterium]|nr:NAD-glutamate dehydrogenase [Pseudomonadales bacterium]
MNSVEDLRREAFLEQLEELIHHHLDAGAAQRLCAFSRGFHASTPYEDLEGRNLEDVFGALISVRALIEERSAAAPTIRVFNPTMQADGWVSSHTIAQIHHRDMPFVVDSFLMALGRQNLTLHCMHNVVLHVDRDEDGRFLAYAGPGEGRDEVLIHAEIDRLDPSEFSTFEADLAETIADVHAAVDDFEPTRARVRTLIDDLDELPAAIGADEVAEARAFLEWLLDDHFTFLGYREFEIVDDGDGEEVRQIRGTELGVLRTRPRPARTRRLADMPDATRSFILEPRILQFSKGGTRSRVHRPAYPDYVAVKRFDADGRVIGERGVLGLYTSAVYMEPPDRIPVLRRRVDEVMARSGFVPGGFDGKVLRQVLATYPRDELFQSEPDELFDSAMRVTNNHERNRLQVFVRQDRYGMFFSCLVYTPREIYTTALREGIQAILVEELGALDAEFTSYFSESILIRTHFVLRVDPAVQVAWDAHRIETRIRALARHWEDDLRDALLQEYGEHRARGLFERYRRAFPSAYLEQFDGRMAVYDIGHLERLSADSDLVMRLYRYPEDAPTRLRLKVFHEGALLPLSDLLPLLENLGVRVQEQRPFAVAPSDRRGASPDGRALVIYDFTLEHDQELDLHHVGPLFEEAFVRIWRREANNDRFNRLVLSAGLAWRDVVVLRAYARYMKQIRFPLDQAFIADTLVRHAELTARLVRYFHLRHDPARAAEEVATEALRGEILEALDAIPSLNEDRILRRYLELVDVTLRTNHFQRGADGAPKRHLSMKLASGRLPEMPKPALAFEIFVSAPDMEGVHLRTGAIARGGLRWSDRIEDYRTEVLGLVKAQRVKNAVIVPEGAKGGFVITAPTDGLDRDARQALGIACYSTLIRGMLDLTDNRVDGVVVPPVDVRRHDGDDPYLVVAADKGTATFSDIANGIAEEYGFWFGDAFASGGSRGYDHKKMGITAKGAWVSVQRHFAERGLDVQADPVTVLGIGDMAGDVFGNGMLLSRALRLVAAFNHMHLFIDPTPDAEGSFAERERLFALPRSSWEDYDRSLISKGGGVFPRSLKSIPISAEMKAAFGLDGDRMTPDELIHALLKAPVDLIWNGGIGTYVKAREETHGDVGDKANDAVRVNGDELRCAVFGEGGNLGLTQRGRIEAARGGVALNTDFIDNSGGVDCSDHEVNIKLLLGEVVGSGDLTVKQRNVLLEAMTDEVSALVLRNNFLQAQALSLASRHSLRRVGEYQRFIARMEAEQDLDRALEELPNDDQLAERIREEAGLTRPELSVLIAYAKAFLKARLVETDLCRQDSVRAFGRAEFPAQFNARFEERLQEHFVYPNIVATQIANDLVHHMGITFVSHLQEYTGANPEEVVRAWLIVRETFGIAELFERIRTLPATVSMDTRLEMMLSFMRLGRRAGRWFLRHRRGQLDPAEQVEFFAPSVAALRSRWVTDLESANSAREAELRARYVAEGVPEDLAALGAEAGNQVASLAIIQAAHGCDHDLVATAGLYQSLATRLRLDGLSDVLGRVDPHNLWQAMERDALLDDLITHNGALCVRVLDAIDDDDALPDADAWFEARPAFEETWTRICQDVFREGQGDFSMYSMAVRKLGDLLRAL